MARRPSGLRMLLWIGVGTLVLIFAVEGGEYGTHDLWRQRSQMRRLTSEIDSVSRVIDSLARYETRLERDPRLQERVAREVFGMVRDGELLYRFYDPSRADSTKK